MATATAGDGQTVIDSLNLTTPSLEEMAAAKDRHDGEVDRVGRLEPEMQSRTAFVPVGVIKVERKYQRPASAKAVQEIINNFDVDAFGIPFLLEDEHGTFWVVDGQTRLAAVHQMYGPDTQVECEIASGLPLHRAAALFGKRNNSRAVLPIDKFLAAVTAEDPEAVAILEVARSVGLDINRGGANSHGVIRAVAALYTVYRGPSGKNAPPRPELLRQTLAILGESWGSHTTSFAASLVVGLSMVLERYRAELNIQDLTNKLKSFPGGALRMVAAGKALRDSLGGTNSHGVALSIVHRYNTGRSVRKLPDWRQDRLRGEEE